MGLHIIISSAQTDRDRYCFSLIKHTLSLWIIRFFLSIAIVLFYISIAHAESIVFDYDDFGPQALAYQTIGFQWYQWNSTGGSDPTKLDVIKVVVYWNEPVEKVKEKYPVNPKKKKDYRYLSFESAIKYLNSAIAEMPDGENLIDTRNRLLGKK